MDRLFYELGPEDTMELKRICTAMTELGAREAKMIIMETIFRLKFQETTNNIPATFLPRGHKRLARYFPFLGRNHQDDGQNQGGGGGAVDDDNVQQDLALSLDFDVIPLFDFLYFIQDGHELQLRVSSLAAPPHQIQLTSSRTTGEIVKTRMIDIHEFQLAPFTEDLEYHKCLRATIPSLHFTFTLGGSIPCKSQFFCDVHKSLDENRCQVYYGNLEGGQSFSKIENFPQQTERVCLALSLYKMEQLRDISRASCVVTFIIDTHKERNGGPLPPLIAFGMGDCMMDDQTPLLIFACPWDSILEPELGVDVA